MKLYRFEVFIDGKSRFVDWYDGDNYEDALELFLEDCHRYQLPNGFTYQSREATEKEMNINN